MSRFTLLLTNRWTIAGAITVVCVVSLLLLSYAEPRSDNFGAAIAFEGASMLLGGLVLAWLFHVVTSFQAQQTERHRWARVIELAERTAITRTRAITVVLRQYLDHPAPNDMNDRDLPKHIAEARGILRRHVGDDAW